jgi:hypothetical protein
MKIGIDLNEVLRDFIGQIEYTYEKYKVPENADVEMTPVDSFDLLKHFPFEGGIDELNKFMYEEAALEIFGHADELHDNLINRLNMYNMDIVDDEEHEIILVSREAINSIPATFFFLSKTGCRLSNIKFYTRFQEMWDDIDVLITANPLLIENKPENRVAIKINAPYNKNVNGDYEFDTLLEFMNDHKILSDIGNITDVNYEEIK